MKCTNCGKDTPIRHIIKSGVEVCAKCLRELVPADKLAKYLERLA